MKKKILTGLMAAIMAFTVAAPLWGIKAEAKYVDWSEYDKSTCICTGNYRNINCTSKRHLVA
ncbi:hypothetical protein [Butyrivibrio sp. MB2005]|uniref:hypothetical protein n=1 Tax=Butyrivibrio sp. MB2005 TaxID=1280678 RepID=UPI00040D0C88|nr:hypothetical protein [Butyrivibrio sp. MB2005]